MKHRTRINPKQKVGPTRRNLPYNIFTRKQRERKLRIVNHILKFNSVINTTVETSKLIPPQTV